MTTTYDLVRYLSELDESLNADLDLSDATMPTEEKARLLFAVEQVQKTLSAFRTEVAALLFADMESDELIVPGLPPLLRSTGGRRTQWKGGKLAEDVTKKVLEELADDVPSMTEVAERVQLAIVRCSGIDNASHSWRKRETKKLGLNVNRYCDYEPGTKTEVKFL